MRRALILVVVALAVPAPAGAATVLEVPAGAGATVHVEDTPFRLAVVDRRGRELVATVPAGSGGVTVGVDGPQPLGTVGGYPALGWVAGFEGGATMPAFLWTGNRLFGAHTGVLVEVTGVRAVSGRTVTVSTSSGRDTTLTLRRLRGGGVRIDAPAPDGIGATAAAFTLASPPGEGLYGLGGRKDAFDQRGRLRNVWVEQQNAGDERADPVAGDYTFPNGPQATFYAQPVLYGSRGWAAWTGGTALGRLDLAASRRDAVRWGVGEPDLSLTLAGGGLSRAARAVAGHQGRSPAPPRWAYRPWIDVINEGEGEAAPNGSGFAGGARVAADLREIAAMRRKLRLPIGVLGVEGWHAVPDARRLFGSLRRQGLHLSAYWNPYLAPGGPADLEARARDAVVEDATGAPFPVLTSRNTIAHVVDFTAPEAADFWAGQVARSSRLGFEGFMHDFGEFVTDGMRFHDGSPVATAHNRYPVLYHAAARRALDAWARTHDRFDPFFYVRAGYTGVPRSTPGVFPGDETTDWGRGSGLPSVPPAMLNLALGGAYAFTTDVGGYFDFVAPRTTPELLIRWSQLAAFTPIMRLHNSTSKGQLLPWEAGEEALSIYRRYARAKVRLIGLVDRLARAAARGRGVGPVRPLVLSDPGARSVADEWLLGPDLLVAPVLERGARERRVYLPDGRRWRRAVVDGAGRLRARGPVLDGGQTITAPAPLADIPLFCRVVRRSLRARPCPAGARARAGRPR